MVWATIEEKWILRAVGSEFHFDRDVDHVRRFRTGPAYLSDLSDEQWAIIERELPPTSGDGRARTVHLREVVNAIFYRLWTGCSWEMLPHNFPPKSTVFEYFAGWRNNGTWEYLHDVLRRGVRKQDGREATASAAIVDSESAKTTETRGERGYNAEKNMKGRKRYILVDTLRLLIAMVITAANVQDRDRVNLVFQEARGETRLKIV